MKVRFWYVVWCGDQPSKVVLPVLFSISSCKVALVAELMQFLTTNTVKYYFYQISTWLGGGGNIFITASSNILQAGDSFLWKSLWRQFLLIEALEKNFMVDNLRKSWIIIMLWCCIGKQGKESIDHLLLQHELWVLIFRLLDTTGSSPNVWWRCWPVKKTFWGATLTLKSGGWFSCT